MKMELRIYFEMIEIILQIVCAVLGASAVILVGCKRHSIYRWGYVLGIINVPMWILVEIWATQWPLLPVNVLYLYGWIQGFRNHWKKKSSE